MSRAAATSSTRSIRPPVSLVNSSSGWKSRIACSTGIGMKSCTWKASDLRSSLSGNHGRSTWRTTTFWLATPTTTFLVLNLACAHSCLMAPRDGVGVDHLAVTHRAGGRATCPKRSSVAGALAHRQLGGAYAGGPDVETHYWSVLPRARPLGSGLRPRRSGVVVRCQQDASADRRRGLSTG